MCPHCMIAALGASIVSVPLIPSAFRYMKAKFSRQEAARGNFSTLYGKKDSDGAA